MKILIVAEVSITQVIGGAERVLRDQALGLAERGHAVRLLTRLPEGEKEERIVVRGIAEHRYPVGRLGPIAFVISSIRNARRAFATMAREHAPDVLLVHQALPGLAVLGAFPRIPAVYVCHSLAHEEFEVRNRPPSGVVGRVWYRCQSLARRIIERAVLMRARRVIVLSDFMRRRVFTRHRIDPERILVIPSGTDTKRFSPLPESRVARSALSLLPDQFVLATVRNLVPRMGLDALIGAMTQVRQAIPQVRLLIGGEGPLRSELEQQVKAIGLEDCVRLLGFIPELALPDYYRAADLFVLPTAQLEGFGLVTIEALASGTPVFGTRIGATEEILGALDQALLSSGTDAESLAAGIVALYRRFAADPATRAKLAEAGRALVLREYTWTRHCERMEKALMDVLDKKGG